MVRFVIKPPPDEAGKAWPAILIGLFVAFGGVLYGYDTGNISGVIAMPYWLQLFSTGAKDSMGNPAITSSQSSQIVSILSAGTFFGALSAAPAADFFGRRIGLMIGICVFMFGVVLQTASTSLGLLLAGRFFAGLGVGWSSATIPIYQSETAPKWIRGTIVGCYQLCITIGLLIASVVDHSTADIQSTACYRIPIAVQFAWGLILLIGLIFLPETPRMWIRRGKPDRAAKSLGKLRQLPVDHPAIIDELAEVQATHEYDLSLGKSTYADCFRGNYGKRLLTGCLLQALQQLTGVNFIFYYGTQYFKNSGLKNPFLISVITASVNVVSTFPGLYLVESWGRRPLLLFGAIGMAACQFIVAGVGTGIGLSNQAGQQCLIAFVCFYIFFVSCTASA